MHGEQITSGDVLPASESNGIVECSMDDVVLDGEAYRAEYTDSNAETMMEGVVSDI